MIIGRFDVIDYNGIGIMVYEDGICVGWIEGVTINDCLDEDEIDNLLYGDIDDVIEG